MHGATKCNLETTKAVYIFFTTRHLDKSTDSSVLLIFYCCKQLFKSLQRKPGNYGWRTAAAYFECPEYLARKHNKLFIVNNLGDSANNSFEFNRRNYCTLYALRLARFSCSLQPQRAVT